MDRRRIMADRKIVDLPTSQTLSDTDYMLVNQNGTPVWVVTDKMKQNAVNAVKHPDTLPNPKKLKFTGAVTAEYDGSTEQTINIPAGGTGGTSDYNALSNKPQVNNVELSGNKTLDDLGIQEKIASVVENKVQFDKEISTSKVSATTVEGDNLYDKTTIDGKLGAKLDKNQGSVNQGKFLSVGSDGNVQLVEAPSGGGGSDYTLPQATENALGGIKAKAKTDETVEVVIDTKTGKLYVPTYPESSMKLVKTVTLDGESVEVIELLSDISMYKHIIIKVKTVPDSTNQTSTYYKLVNSDLEALTNNDKWVAPKTATAYTFGELINDGTAIVSILPSNMIVGTVYMYGALYKTSYGLDINRWTSLLLTTNDTSWKFAQGTTIEIFAR